MCEEYIYRFKQFIELFDIILQIMFLFLDISIDHFDAITENSCLDGKWASIHYTKTFDILKPKDRSEIMDILFYMAAIQTYNFLFPF